MNKRREYLTAMAEDIAKATNGDVEKIKNIIFGYFSISEKKPQDTFASMVRNLMGKDT